MEHLLPNELKKMQELNHILAEIERSRCSGSVGYTIEELDQILSQEIQNADTTEYLNEGVIWTEKNSSLKSLCHTTNSSLTL